jgi:hypothetical protein
VGCGVWTKRMRPHPNRELSVLCTAPPCLNLGVVGGGIEGQKRPEGAAGFSHPPMRRRTWMRIRTALSVGTGFSIKPHQECEAGDTVCRSIKVLRKPGEAAAPAELSSAALQFVRKITGFDKPSKANQQAFERAVLEISHASDRLLKAIQPSLRDERYRSKLPVPHGTRADADQPISNAG